MSGLRLAGILVATMSGMPPVSHGFLDQNIAVGLFVLRLDLEPLTVMTGGRFESQPQSGATADPKAASEPASRGGASGWWIMVAIATIAIASTRRGRAAARDVVGRVSRAFADRATSQNPTPAPAAGRHGREASESAPAKGAVEPLLYGVRGEFAGVALELGEEPVIIGRDPRVSHLVFVTQAPSVSRRHCSIRFDAGQQAVVLEDLWSTNGTFLQSGQQVPAGEPTRLGSTDRFYLGDPAVLFEVRY